MKINKKRYLIIAFLTLFCISMVIHMVIDNTMHPFDSGLYWERGKECGWDVKNITDGFRGYLLPYIFSMCYKFGMLFGNEFLGYRIFISVIFAFTFTYLYVYVAKLLQFKLSDKSVMGGGDLWDNISLFF